jgi:hypothetical protein
MEVHLCGPRVKEALMGVWGEASREADDFTDKRAAI